MWVAWVGNAAPAIDLAVAGATAMLYEQRELAGAASARPFYPS